MFSKPNRIILFAIALAMGLTIFTISDSAQTRDKRVAPIDANQKKNFERQPKVAVLAGVGRYASRSGLTGLRFPAHDVDMMQAELEKQGYKVVALKDQEATRGAIEQSLADAKDLVDQNSGTILFFFSGHGFADDGQNYLATYEAAAANLAGSGLPVKRVEELMKATGAQRQMMFLDACRNEAGKAVGARSFDRLQAAAGLHALLSTKAGKISYEDDSLGSGVFTHFLVEGLRGQAAGTDGLITFHDLSTYVVDGVSAYGFKHGQMQVPYEAGEFSGDFLVGESVAGAADGGRTSVATRPMPVPGKTSGGRPVRQDPSERAPGAQATNSKDGLRYVWIPPGQFTMGCSPGDLECRNDEKPPHLVIITKGYWMGQTPVTQEAWEKVMGTNPSHFKGPKLPVEQVTFDESAAYCVAIGGHLPTEAQWEYAARAGGAEPRYGDMDAIAWTGKNSGGTTHPVGQKQPNAWGLYDMIGNVCQWTMDWWGAYSGGGQIDPEGPGASGGRAVRGGSWLHGQTVWFRASSRYGQGTNNFRWNNLGLRCVAN